MIADQTATLIAVVNCPFPKRITNEVIADRLRCFARLLAIRSEDFYRINAYDDAASIIAAWSEPISEIAKREGGKGLRVIPGVGRSISEKIVELVNTGTFEAWETLTIETPASVLDLLVWMKSEQVKSGTLLLSLVLSVTNDPIYTSEIHSRVTKITAFESCRLSALHFDGSSWRIQP